MKAIAVIHKDSGEQISYHATVEKALIAIHNYERLDKMDGLYEPDKYDWDFTDIELWDK